MKQTKHFISQFFLAFIAGCCIGIGGTVFLSIKDAFPGGQVVGSLLFAIGLLVICTRQYNLFTGKVCYSLSQKPSYLLDLAIIWVGNFVGCGAFALLLNNTRLNLSAVAEKVVDAKMNDNYLSLFILGILCNILIFIAVDGYKRLGANIGGFLCIFLGVMVFILIGSEHCVADMFYWCLSNTIYSQPLESLLRLLVITLGNIVGGLFVPVVEIFIAKLKNN